MTYSDFLLLNIVLSAIMTGIIWLVQIVIYPSFYHAATKEFHKHHVKSIGPIVAPLMIIELVSMIWLLSTNQHLFLIASAMCLLVIWLSTFLIQVPIHNKIREKITIPSVKRLVLSNWIRTIFWTVKTILLLYYATS